MCSFCALTQGQNKIEYRYDGAGNQIKRAVIYMMKRAVAEPEEEIKPIEKGDMGEKIQIYPNPTKGEITVGMSGFEEFENANVTIVDIQGRVILKERLLADDTYLNISSSPGGTYVMTIDVDGKQHQWKIIKID